MHPRRGLNWGLPNHLTVSVLVLQAFRDRMPDGNGCCTEGYEFAGYISCAVHLLEEWMGQETLDDYLSFLNYVLWVFTPLVIVFILPLFILLFLYLSILFLHVYKRKNELREAYSNNVWDGARKTLATLWDGHGTIWHGNRPTSACKSTNI